MGWETGCLLQPGLEDKIESVSDLPGTGGIRSMMSHYRFKLFVSGVTSRSKQAIHQLKQLCEERLAGRYEMTVIDILERPQLAEEAMILVTPTVIKEKPDPPQRVIGDLSVMDQVFSELCIAECPEGAHPHRTCTDKSLQEPLSQ